MLRLNQFGWPVYFGLDSFPWRYSGFLVKLSDFPQGVRVGGEKKAGTEAGFSGSQFGVVTQQLCTEHSQAPESFPGRAPRQQGQEVTLGLCCVWPSGLPRCFWASTEPQQPRITQEHSQHRSSCPHHFFVLFLFLPLSRQTNMFCCEYTSQQTGKQRATKTNY